MRALINAFEELISSCYIPPPYFIDRKEKYLMASDIFLYRFLQTLFAKLQFVIISVS